MNDTSRNFVFSLIVAALTLAAIVVIVVVGFRVLEDRYQQQITQALVLQLSEEEKKAYYERLEGAAGAMWDTVPEHRVARIGQAGKAVAHKRVLVQFNNAGMRSSRPYGPKKPGTFRLICLGDSFVFGEGGLENDRFCDQIEAQYRERGITVEGKPIETLAIGLGSWTMVQEAAYLSSRLSAYDPDVVLVLSTSNDITVASGVTGKGVPTQQFSAAEREYGSGLYSLEAPHPLHFPRNGLLAEDLSPISGNMWEEGMESLKRLANLQNGRGGKIVFAVLEGNSRFRHVYLKKFYESKIEAPVYSTSYFHSPETKLPHDGHPNRKGHEILASHAMHVLHELGWIVSDDLPAMDSRLAATINPDFSADEILNEQKKSVEGILRSRLDFSKLKPGTVQAVMGGLFRGRQGKNEVVWSSVRSAFLLRSEPDHNLLRLEVAVPNKAELQPFELSVRINGVPAFSGRLPAGRQALDISLPEATLPLGVVEVAMETPRYFTTILDHRMKSFRLISAQLL